MPARDGSRPQHGSARFIQRAHERANDVGCDAASRRVDADAPDRQRWDERTCGLRDDFVLWRLVGGEPVVCYAVEGDEGLAITIEHYGEIIVAEMMPEIDATLSRAQALKRTLLAIGLKDARS